MGIDDSVRMTGQLVAQAVEAGHEWATWTAVERARALALVADELDLAASELVAVAERETHLTETRLRSELVRTTFQLRFLGDAAVRGDHLDLRIDEAVNDWPAGAPRPDLRRGAVPIGPVVVFAASNFPFAFSVAGGDSASALAAGCPVIVKAHGGHPQLSLATADVVLRALTAAGAPDGLFALVRSSDQAREILTHPDIKAGAFTGSIPVGRALFDLAQSRPEPIPFFGELGSVNPVFVTHRSGLGRAAEIVESFTASFLAGAGQFCTKPGVVFVAEGSEVVERLTRLDLPAPVELLNDRVTHGHQSVREALEAKPSLDVLVTAAPGPSAFPAARLLKTTVEDVFEDFDGMVVECFGPTALIVTYSDERQLLEVARRLHGQLTATIVAEDDDALAPQLAALLARKVGRLLWNQWPTGVSVTYAQQHGGPFPATTAPGTTSVGAAALQRFVRPVAYQGFPQHLLPDELRDRPTTLMVRRINGELSWAGRL